MSNSNAISPKLLEVLCCPVGKQPLEQRGDQLICTACGLAFPIEDGIPVLIAERAALPPGVAALADLRCPPPEAGSPQGPGG